MIVDQLMAGSAIPVATCVGPGFGPFYDPNLKPDAYDPQQAADLLNAAGYSVTIAPAAKIESVGTPMLGQAMKVKGYTSVAGMIVVIQQSSDQQSWTPVGAAAADAAGNYETSVPGPPVLGSVWYRANFTGYALNETFAGTSFGADQANSYINEGASIGDRQLVPESLTDPIAISSVTNDAAVVLAVVIVLVVIAVVAMRRRKPEAAAK
jgi:ABC-type transport system substrate-binding protein